MHPITRFNIRVYGILINELDQVLLADEAFRNGTCGTKYPGGGLEFGEGLKDALIRECKEEMGIKVIVKKHFYTTDFFVSSFLDTESQVISIYYLIESQEWQKIKTSTRKFDFEMNEGKAAESFRWVNLAELANEDSITLPIDKVVTEMLMRLKIKG